MVETNQGNRSSLIQIFRSYIESVQRHLGKTYKARKDVDYHYCCESQQKFIFTQLMQQWLSKMSSKTRQVKWWAGGWIWNRSYERGEVGTTEETTGVWRETTWAWSSHHTIHKVGNPRSFHNTIYACYAGVRGWSLLYESYPFNRDEKVLLYKETKTVRKMPGCIKMQNWQFHALGWSYFKDY